MKTRLNKCRFKELCTEFLHLRKVSFLLFFQRYHSSLITKIFNRLQTCSYFKTLFISRYVVISICVSFFLLINGTATASNKKSETKSIPRDSLKMAYLEDMALKNPLMRQVKISTEYIPGRDINTSLNNEDFLTGKAQIIRNSFFFRLPLLTFKNNSFNLSLGSFNQHVSLTEIKMHNPDFTFDDNFLSKTTVNVSLGYTTRTTIFGKPALINTAITGLIKPDFSESVLSGTGVVLLNLKRNKQTSLSVGGAVSISPNSKVPAFLLVSYEHHFVAPDLLLTLNLPYRAILRKPVAGKSSISFVNELSGTFAFYNIRNSYVPERSRYGTSEVKSGFTFEHRIGKKFVFGASCGALYTTSSKMKESSSYWGNSYFIKNENTLDPYFNISVSVLPFL